MFIKYKVVIGMNARYSSCYCIVHKGRSSSYRLVDCIGLDLAWFWSSEHLCVFMVMCIY